MIYIYLFVHVRKSEKENTCMSWYVWRSGDNLWSQLSFPSCESSRLNSSYQAW